MKAAVIYWSGTGNTQAMAEAVLAGMNSAGADTVILTPDQVNASEISSYDAIAMGCPAMGAEVLEESEFEPMYDSIKGSLAGKKVALFGSYGWGDGEWMRNWEEDCEKSGISLVTDSVLANDAPDQDAIEACKALGAALVK
ncbi:MAG: flavodoxin [Parasporobacterium sp.]|nr:flavodoxin [Parasporobacterium sp.]